MRVTRDDRFAARSPSADPAPALRRRAPEAAFVERTDTWRRERRRAGWGHGRRAGGDGGSAHRGSRRVRGRRRSAARDLGATAATVRDDLLDLAQRDSEAYEAVVRARHLPRETDGERANRKTAMNEAMHLAAEVPLETARAAAPGRGARGADRADRQPQCGQRCRRRRAARVGGGARCHPQRADQPAVPAGGVVASCRGTRRARAAPGRGARCRGGCPRRRRDPHRLTAAVAPGR